MLHLDDGGIFAAARAVDPLHSGGDLHPLQIEVCPGRALAERVGWKDSQKSSRARCGLLDLVSMLEVSLLSAGVHHGWLHGTSSLEELLAAVLRDFSAEGLSRH